MIHFSSPVLISGTHSLQLALSSEQVKLIGEGTDSSNFKVSFNPVKSTVTSSIRLEIEPQVSLSGKEVSLLQTRNYSSPFKISAEPSRL